MTSSKFSYLQKAPLPNTITLEVMVSAYEFGRGPKHLVHNSVLHGLYMFLKCSRKLMLENVISQAPAVVLQQSDK